MIKVDDLNLEQIKESFEKYLSKRESVKLFGLIESLEARFKHLNYCLESNFGCFMFTYEFIQRDIKTLDGMIQEAAQRLIDGKPRD